MATKKIKEYGGKEIYASKSAMMKHEKKESPAMEKREAGMKKGGMAKKSSDIIGRAVKRKTADVKGRAMKKGA
jgi:hypothetical protein